MTTTHTTYARIGERAHAHGAELRTVSSAIGTVADLARRLYVDHDTTGEYALDTGPVQIEALLTIIEAAAASLHRRITGIVGEDDMDIEVWIDG